MAGKRPTTIEQYLAAAPAAGQPHLRRLNALLAEAAPDATPVIKWGNPFFVEPRFLFAYSAHKAHLSLAPSPEALERFRAEIGGYRTTKNFLQVRYDEPLPERLIRKIAAHRVKTVAARTDDGFW